MSVWNGMEGTLAGVEVDLVEVEVGVGPGQQQQQWIVDQVSQ